MKGTFLHSRFFRESRLDHLIIFSLMELELKVDSSIFVYRWNTDLVIVCFSHLFLSQIIDGNSLVTFVVISQWTPL